MLGRNGKELVAQDFSWDPSKKHILLIQPKPLNTNLITGSADGQLYPLGLFIIDALTPEDEWDVKILDEGRERFDIERINAQNITLAGINSWTNQAPRAYDIAASLRQRGVPVILGGAHPSVLPDEALRYADSVCIGEVEGVWKDVLADVKNGGLKKIYKGGNPPLDMVPILRNPMRDKYAYASIQTARGCPNNCSFCSVTTNNGAVIRYRPIADVVEEFRHIKQNKVFVVDDNFIGAGKRGRERAIELCKELAGLRRQGIRKYWGTQATQTLGQEDEVLEWMYKAGCRLVLFGLESINPDVIKDVHKGINNINDFKKNIRNTQRHGIAVIASFVFGTDEDSPTVFEDTVRFVKDSMAAAQNLNIVCPLPGTRLFNDVLPSGRLLYTNWPRDWQEYNLKKVVLDPIIGSPLELYKRRQRAEQELCSTSALVKRIAHTLWETRSLSATVAALAWNRQSPTLRKDYEDQTKMMEKEEQERSAQEQAVF